MGKPHFLSEKCSEEEGDAPSLLSPLFFSEDLLFSRVLNKEARFLVTSKSSYLVILF